MRGESPDLEPIGRGAVKLLYRAALNLCSLKEAAHRQACRQAVRLSGKQAGMQAGRYVGR